jgi:TonB family protein
MPKDVRFWRNVALIGLAHIALVVGLIRWSRETKPVTAQSVVWMNGGAGDAAASPATAETPPAVLPKPARVEETPVPEPERAPTVEREEDRPVLTSARSDIQLPTPTPVAKPSPTPPAKPSPKPTPKPTPKATPKQTPKPTPKPKAKPKPTSTPKKVVVAKASPKPSPKVKPTPAATEEEADQTDTAEEEKKKIAKAALEKAKEMETDSGPKKAVAAQGGNGKGSSAGAGGHAGGAGGESQFGWYGSMLHDRFYSEWVQPNTNLTSGAKASALVKIRIEKDGRISSFEIIKPSGNAVVDDSVTAVAKRVTQVDPLPAGLGSGEHYDVKINFELNSDQ